MNRAQLLHIQVGRIMAQLFARELVSRNAIPTVIFAAPSLASLQTAVDIQNYIGLVFSDSYKNNGKHFF